MSLDFFNGLSGDLDVRLNEPPQRAAPTLANLQAAPSASVTGVTLRMTVPERIRGELEMRELHAEEWERVVIAAPSIRMRSDTAPELVVDHAAPGGTSFTVRQLTLAVEETERRARGSSKWLGGVDVHHIFFEGIHLEADGVWTIAWGS